MRWSFMKIFAAIHALFLIFLLYKFGETLSGKDDIELVGFVKKERTMKTPNPYRNRIHKKRSKPEQSLEAPLPVPLPPLELDSMRSSIQDSNYSRLEGQVVKRMDEAENNRSIEHQENDDVPPPLQIEGTRFVLYNRHVCNNGTKVAIANSSAPFPVLLVLVHSRRENFLRREAIRNTYGSLYTYKNWDIRVIFLIGKGKKKKSSANKDATTQVRLAWEFDIFGDIIMGVFVESPANYSVSTTYKHVMGVRWVMEYCSRAKYIAKVNDDHFINTLEIIDGTIPTMKEQKVSFFCNVLFGSLDETVDDDGKIGSTKIPGKLLQYCSGEAYLADFQTLKSIYGMIPTVPFYKQERDDLFVTGRLRQAFLQRSTSSTLLRQDSPTDDLKILNNMHQQNEKEEPCFYVANSFLKMEKMPFQRLIKSSEVKRFWCLWWNVMNNKGILTADLERRFVWTAMAQ